MRRTLAQIAAATIPHYRDGGRIRGPGTGTSDSVNIKASNGEFIMPTDTVRKVGARRLQDLVDMTHEPSGKAPLRGRYVEGGLVDEKRPNSFGDAAAATQAPGTTVVQPPAPVPAAPPPVAAPAPAPAASAVSQIPTGGLTAPAADGSQDRWSNTETGRNLSNIASALPGSLGGAIPAVARTGGAISGGINAATRLLNAGAGAAAVSALPGAATAQTSPTSAAGAGRGLINPPAVNPSAPTPASPPAVSSTTSATAPGTTSDVSRVGNSYSGSNVAGDITVNGRTAGGGFMNSGEASAQRAPIGMTPEAAQRAGLIGAQVIEGNGARERLMAAGTGQAPAAQVSQQNMAAADNLAGSQQQDARTRLMALATGGGQAPGVQAPMVRNSANDWQARNDLRNLAVGASSITNTPEWSRGATQDWRGRQVGGQADQNGAVAAYNAAQRNDLALRSAQPGLDQAALRENAGLQREGMQQTGETQRTGIRAQGVNDTNQIARGRLSLEQIAAGYTNRSADRMDRAQADLENARTPEGQKSARERLLALAGKAPQNEWGVQVTPATKNADGSSTQGSVWRYNKATGETARVDGGEQAAQRVSTQAQFNALPKGATYVGADGRTYRKPA
ncbi:hypothetical protein [Acidovorax sp. LjRoot117]|uniref:hypothetical protein n=1 Tax=Acidovorax sp. LjRoot117 TaxID=3342255 RepID=UPI003ED0EC90